MSSHFLGSGTSLCVVVSLEDQSCNSECSFFSSFLACIAQQTSCGMEYPFGQFGSAGLVVTPARILPHPTNGGILERQHWYCASSAQQEPKHWGVTNTFVATNTEHRTVRAAMGKVNSIPVRTNTIIIIILAGDLWNTKKTCTTKNWL